MYGPSVGSLTVRLAEGEKQQVIFTKNGQQSYKWKSAKVTLKTSKPFQVLKILLNVLNVFLLPTLLTCGVGTIMWNWNTSHVKFSHVKNFTCEIFFTCEVFQFQILVSHVKDIYLKISNVKCSNFTHRFHMWNFHMWNYKWIFRFHGVFSFHIAADIWSHAWQATLLRHRHRRRFYRWWGLW